MKMPSFITNLIGKKVTEDGASPERAVAKATQIVIGDGKPMDPKTKGLIVGLASGFIGAAVQTWQADANPFSQAGFQHAMIAGLATAIMTLWALFRDKPRDPGSMADLAVEVLRKAVAQGALQEHHIEAAQNEIDSAKVNR